MEFKKLLNKVHDKVSYTNSSANSPSPSRQRSFKDKRHTTLTRWRDKWGDVPRPRFFSNSSSNNTNRKTKANDNNNNVYSSSCYSSAPLPLPQIPTITLSTPSLLKRSQSTIAPRPPPPAMTPSSNRRRLAPSQKPRPISYTPTQTQRLSVPHVVDHLRAPYQSSATTDMIGATKYVVHSYNGNNNNDNNDDDDDDDDDIIELGDAGSFYNIPTRYSPSPSPSRQVTWYIPSGKTASSSLDDTTDFTLENDSSVDSMMSTHLKSSVSSSSSTSIIGLVSKENTNRTGHQGQEFSLARQVSAFLGNERIQPHKESNNDTDEDDIDENENQVESSIVTIPTPSTTINTAIADANVVNVCQKDNHGDRQHYDQLAALHVSNTMMMMREHQLELQMTRLRIDNQRLQQQIDDMVSGTWSSTTHLLAENDRLELQIQQLQKQQRLVRSSITGKGELHWRDEQEALRHTRAQLGLVEYLEGEPDIMAALNRFKKLLATSC